MLKKLIKNLSRDRVSQWQDPTLGPSASEARVLSNLLNHMELLHLTKHNIFRHVLDLQHFPHFRNTFGNWKSSNCTHSYVVTDLKYLYNSLPYHIVKIQSILISQDPHLVHITFNKSVNSNKLVLALCSYHTKTWKLIKIWQYWTDLTHSFIPCSHNFNAYLEQDMELIIFNNFLHIPSTTHFCSLHFPSIHQIR
jgi:hypothetical protein